MFGLTKNLFAKSCNPIGVDFGSDALRLAQVQWAGNEYKLIAAASADVRMPNLDEEALKKALPWEARGKLPIDPSQAVLRHLVAGEIYQDQDPKIEVIVMAAARELVNQFLAAATKAKLEVVGMNVEPQALLDCFNHVYRRNDGETVNLLVDIGSTGTRAVIIRGTQIVFARTIPVGGDTFTRAVASALKMSVQDAKMLRIKMCHAEPAAAAPAAAPEPVRAPAARAAGGSDENSFALLGAGMAKADKQNVLPAPARGLGVPPEHNGGAAPRGDSGSGAKPQATDQMRAVAAACAEPVGKLVEELDLCRRYYEATFPNKPVQRLLFVGGEARQRSLCAHVARELGLAAQIGDPMVRMGRISEIGVESGMDRRQPQPAWAVAIGLSMGPVAAAAAAAKTEKKSA
jgi:type IV pilus assembly protein PilM